MDDTIGKSVFDFINDRTKNPRTLILFLLWGISLFLYGLYKYDTIELPSGSVIKFNTCITLNSFPMPINSPSPLPPPPRPDKSKIREANYNKLIESNLYYDIDFRPPDKPLDFSHNDRRYAKVKDKKNKWGIVDLDEEGKFIVPPKYSAIYKYFTNVALVKDTTYKKWGIVTGNKERSSFKYTTPDFHNGQFKLTKANLESDCFNQRGQKKPCN